MADAHARANVDLMTADCACEERQSEVPRMGHTDGIRVLGVVFKNESRAGSTSWSSPTGRSTSARRSLFPDPVLDAPASLDRRCCRRFAAVLFEDLDEAERAVIRHRTSAGVRLRNRTLLSQPLGSSPFDLIVDREVQAAWLEAEATNDGPVDLDDQRVLIAQRGHTGRAHSTGRVARASSIRGRA